jgi:hydrogenase maturation protease
MPDILIIGYGNTLRGDDAMGIHAAHALHDFYCNDGKVRVLATSQLSLDFAEDVSQAQFVVFLDAAEAGAPGQIFSEEVVPADDKVRFTHHCSPRTLLMLAKRLYGNTPYAVSLTMAGAWSEVGVGLSPEAQNKLPELLDRAKTLVDEWRVKVAAKRDDSSAAVKVHHSQADRCR